MLFCSAIKRSKSSLLRELKLILSCAELLLPFRVKNLIKHLIMTYFTIAQNGDKPHKNAP